MRNLLGLADDADSETVRLAATNSALDRAGLGAKQALELSAKPLAPWEEIMSDIAMEVGRTTRAEHNALSAIRDGDLARAARELEVVDAELVPEQEPPVSPPSAAVDDAERPTRSDAPGDESATFTAPLTPPRILTQDEAAEVMRTSRARSDPGRRPRRRARRPR